MTSATKNYWLAYDEVDDQGRIVKLGKVSYYGSGVPVASKAGGYSAVTRDARDAQEIIDYLSLGRRRQQRLAAPECRRQTATPTR
jgi:hypothetical protein